MTSREILLIITSIGAIQSILLGLYFFATKYKTRTINVILALLLISLGIRVAKSTLFIFSSQVPLVILNIGFGAHALSAPLFYLYIKYFKTESGVQIWEVVHLVPGILILILSYYLTLENFWYQSGYSSLLYYSVIYILLANLTLFYRFKSFDKKDLTWLISLTLGITLFLVAYFSNYILQTNSYITAPILYSIVVYCLSFLILKYQSIFNEDHAKKTSSYKYLNLSEEKAHEHKTVIVDIMRGERPYMDPDFTLSRLSEMTSIPGYILSYLFSNFFDMKFNDFINKYRIDEAKIKLRDPKYAHLKISSLAYDCGFNSLSAFNSAFKKFTNTTPSQFRDAIQSP